MVLLLICDHSDNTFCLLYPPYTGNMEADYDNYLEDLQDDYEDRGLSPPDELMAPIDLTADEDLSDSPTSSSSTPVINPNPTGVRMGGPIVPKDFRLCAKYLLLTYPQCPLERGLVVGILKEKLRAWNPKYILACEEDHHETDGKHIHAFAALGRRTNIRSPSQFDIEWAGVTYHGNYQAARNPSAAMRYVGKDGLTYSWGDPPPQPRTGPKKDNTSIKIYKAISEGASLNEIVTTFGPYCVLHFTAVKRLYDYLSGIKYAPLEVWTDNQLVNTHTGNCWDNVKNWLDLNLAPNAPKRTLGQLQLWIYGSTGVGKTWLLEELKKRRKTYCANLDENYWDGLDNTYELICFDEFEGQHPINFMNQLLDGAQMNIRVKGGQFKKSTNTPVIICSNFLPAHVYAGKPTVQLDALNRRLCVCMVDVLCTLKWQ